MTKVCFSPVHKTRFFKNKLKHTCLLPVKEAVSQEVLALHMYPSLRREEIDDVTRHITDCLTGAR